MINKYMCVNGDIVTTDHKNNMNKVEYSDNIGEIFATGNELEMIEEIIPIQKGKLNDQKKECKENIEFTKGTVIILLFGSLLFPTIVCELLLGSNPISKSIFGPMPLSYLMSIVIGTVTTCISVGLIIRTFLDTKIMKSNIKGIESSLEFLNQKELELTAKINKLNNEKTKTEESKINMNSDQIEINNSELLKKLISFINLYYECGYNEKEYLKYYLNGILRQELGGKYTEEQLVLVEQKMRELQEKLAESKKNKPKIFTK